MLRRKLLTILGGLVIMLAAVAALAVWRLQVVLAGVDHVNDEGMALVEQVNELATRLTTVEVELYHIQMGAQRHLDTLIIEMESMRRSADVLGDHSVMSRGRAAEIFARLRGQLPAFAAAIGALATTRDPELAEHHNRRALELSVNLRRDMLELSRLARDHVRAEQGALSAKFRWLVLGLAILFLLVINVSIMLMWRLAVMILRPVDELVEGSRQLGMGRFNHRIEIRQADEFGELAVAFTRLAEQLAAQEQRRIQVLGQVALTLNHELNNATSIIEMQLTLLSQSRLAGKGRETEKCLRQIRASLERMTHTVHALKNIRRVVLTDYAAGVKMLDLEQSIQDGPGVVEPPGNPSTHAGAP